MVAKISSVVAKLSSMVAKISSVVANFSSVVAKISYVLVIFSSVLVENYVYCNSPTQMFLTKTTPLVALILFRMKVCNNRWRSFLEKAQTSDTVTYIRLVE